MKELRSQRIDLEQKSSQLSRQMDAVHLKIKSQMTARNKSKDNMIRQYNKSSDNHKVEIIYFATNKLQHILTNYLFKRHFKSSSRHLFQQLKHNANRQAT